ncbi:MAG: SET domain-containing protein-lysine N-methyltransferase [Verrucomicrobiota bacterium]|nr:SET domain-containing protein-lysine N-methyltransferase [Verrucomicrobiota bacterium]
MSDRSDCFRVSENEHGERATYARFAFGPGELVYTVQGEASTTRTRESIEVGKGQHVEDAYALYLNHSFAPNLRLEGRRMYALDNIAEGEELTFNYLETESEIASPFVCHDTGRTVDSGACNS